MTASLEYMRAVSMWPARRALGEPGDEARARAVARSDRVADDGLRLRVAGQLPGAEAQQRDGAARVKSRGPRRRDPRLRAALEDGPAAPALGTVLRLDEHALLGAEHARLEDGDLRAHG
jgi:hypothetical protein